MQFLNKGESDESEKRLLPNESNLPGFYAPGHLTSSLVVLRYFSSAKPGNLSFFITFYLHDRSYFIFILSLDIYTLQGEQ